MISLKEAQALANQADNQRRCKECLQNLERASTKIESAAKMGQFSTEVEVPGSNPSDFIYEINKLGFEAKMISGYYDDQRINPCVISWFNKD